MSDKLEAYTVNLNAHQEGLLTESWLAMFGGAIKYLLQGMFGSGPKSYASVNSIIKGTPSQVAAFGDALSQEKKYMETFLKYGLNDPHSFASKADLNRAVANFERETGIKWPLT